MYTDLFSLTMTFFKKQTVRKRKRQGTEYGLREEQSLVGK
jgi:hypothetical protein